MPGVAIAVGMLHEDVEARGSGWHVEWTFEPGEAVGRGQHTVEDHVSRGHQPARARGLLGQKRFVLIGGDEVDAGGDRGTPAHPGGVE